MFVEKKFHEEQEYPCIQNNIKVKLAIQVYGWQTFHAMAIEKKQETIGITMLLFFLYGSLWCIVWFACQVNREELSNIRQKLLRNLSQGQGLRALTGENFGNF